ncbi:ABC transporter ATP-binding protein [Bacillus toyonensis]|uniref:ABC transporter ATP-binding protein n=1 Tax=Bacillus toyonensis TaxID=155322 RepID=UPI0003C33661|nr:ABC transporter ATP-binding protein [Bacillus toyonensis]KXY18107.1 sodium ABC transporter ATP-binding protein [Bacillus cereus]AHA10880.1 ABC transporter, ATP-binding protein [Bacillus toyonensis BCT-7112]KMP58734.1 sodium ABC transporter ATP-binding protein [Bacillus toyonensis]MCU4770358.1 ABC transporter ATP-binding protein [Bacillus toyonensis]MCU5725448.1 ABC transporter ATP-binding protein [Bacillus toyonensis]
MKLTNITKKFNNFTAVDNLSLEIKKGEIFGLIGQNGAGKTTTFRMILNLLAPTSGTIEWEAGNIKMLNADSIGYLPEERGLYPKLSVENQILLLGRLKGTSKSVLKKEITHWLEKFDLTDKRKSLIETLSKGNQQKVQLISSIIHKPNLLILDEPFSGLDPINAALLKEAILTLKETGTTIIFSSHRMDHVEELCDNLCVLRGGKSLYHGSIINLKEKYGKINLTIRGPFSSEELSNLPGVLKVTQKKEYFQLLLEKESDAPTIFKYVIKDGFIERFSLDYLSLEEIFKVEVGEHNE